MKLSGESLKAGLGLVLVSTLSITNLSASDHDDGETAIKGRNRNLTDLYVFREDWQTGNSSDSSKLILIQNFNPRSLPGQQYYADTEARYEIHATRIGSA